MYFCMMKSRVGLYVVILQYFTVSLVTLGFHCRFCSCYLVPMLKTESTDRFSFFFVYIALL